MTTRIWSGTCVAISFGLVAGLMAQAPAPQTNPQSSASATSAKKVSITGCVERGSQSPTGTSGTSGAASAASQPKFMLTDAQMSPSGTSGTSGSAASQASATQYRLDGDDAKLTPHVGHKVQIDGTLQETASASASSGGASAASPSGGSTSASASSSPTLKVDDVKMLASTCP